MKTKYWEAIKAEMNLLAQDDKTLFFGQQCASEDFYGTLKDIALDKRIEMPVAEELQLGLCTGLALEGYLPICIYQRIDFLPRACDQLINHLNLIPEMSRGIFTPKIIIRTTIGNKTPLDAGPQHTQDLTKMFESILKFPVFHLKTVEEVHTAYQLTRELNTPTLIIEEQELYNGPNN